MTEIPGPCATLIPARRVNGLMQEERTCKASGIRYLVKKYFTVEQTLCYKHSLDATKAGYTLIPMDTSTTSLDTK